MWDWKEERDDAYLVVRNEYKYSNSEVSVTSVSRRSTMRCNPCFYCSIVLCCAIDTRHLCSLTRNRLAASDVSKLGIILKDNKTIEEVMYVAGAEETRIPFDICFSIV